MNGLERGKRQRKQRADSRKAREEMDGTAEPTVKLPH